MAVALVTGMQGDDPNYYRVIATPKHFDIHSGPEPTRHIADVAQPIAKGVERFAGRIPVGAVFHRMLHHLYLQRIESSRDDSDCRRPVVATVTVMNTEKIPRDEVAQLYLKLPSVVGAPSIALRGFQRVHLEPGQSRDLRFELKNRDLGMVTEPGNPIIAGGDYSVTIGGGQPDTGAAGVTAHFHVDGQITLPE
jgi:hypothetical protein